MMHGRRLRPWKGSSCDTSWKPFLKILQELCGLDEGPFCWFLSCCLFGELSPNLSKPIRSRLITWTSRETTWAKTREECTRIYSLHLRRYTPQKNCFSEPHFRFSEQKDYLAMAAPREWRWQASGTGRCDFSGHTGTIVVQRIPRGTNTTTGSIIVQRVHLIPVVVFDCIRCCHRIYFC